VRELSLFTGAGGGLLGSLILGWRTVAAIEIDPYCQRVLCARGGYVADAEDVFGDGGAHHAVADSGPSLPEHRDGGRSSGAFPVHGDVRDFHPVPGSCDIVTGGFPCQPFSQAGKRLGEDDPRNMWPHAVRVLRESGAPLGFFENVPGLLSSGYFGTVLGDLAEAGFDAEWCVLGADDVGAPHRRKRLWILAYAADRKGVDVPGVWRTLERQSGRRQSGDGRSPWWCDPADVGHADDAGPQGLRDDGERTGERAAGAAGTEWLSDSESIGRREGRPESDGRRPELEQPGGARSDAVDDALRRRHGTPEDEVRPGRDGTELPGEWLAEPYVGRVAHGVASRVDRLRALGNGQVPQAMAAAFMYLAREAGVVTT